MRRNRASAPSARRGSIRMSRPPSPRVLKPRSSASNWCELTPRSARMPSTCCTPWRRRKLEANRKFSGMRWNRGSSGTLSAASGSQSNPNRRPSGPRRSRMPRLCPPPPKVQSTYVPPGCRANPSREASNSTGTWYVVDISCGRSRWGSAPDRCPGALSRRGRRSRNRPRRRAPAARSGPWTTPRSSRRGR